MAALEETGRLIKRWSGNPGLTRQSPYLPEQDYFFNR